MSDDTMPEAQTSGQGASDREAGTLPRSERPNDGGASDREAGTLPRSERPNDGGASESERPKDEGTPTTPRPRRRRGSRGGRNRKKKPAAVTADGTPAPAGAPTGADDDEFVPHDTTDPTADRGLTTDDIADAAREDAGLPPVTP